MISDREFRQSVAVEVEGIRRWRLLWRLHDSNDLETPEYFSSRGCMLLPQFEDWLMSSLYLQCGEVYKFYAGVEYVDK